MDFDWASYGLGILTGIVGVAITLMAVGFWAWATNAREVEATIVDNQMEEAKYEGSPYATDSDRRNRQRMLCISNGPHDSGYHIEECPDAPAPPPLAAAGALVPQLGYVDHHRTRPRRGGR